MIALCAMCRWNNRGVLYVDAVTYSPDVPVDVPDEDANKAANALCNALIDVTKGRREIEGVTKKDAAAFVFATWATRMRGLSNAGSTVGPFIVPLPEGVTPADITDEMILGWAREWMRAQDERAEVPR